MIRDPEKQRSQLHYHLSGNTAKPWMVEGTQPAHMLGTRRFLKAPCIVASKRCTLDFDTSFCNTFRPGLGTVTEKWPISTLLKKYSRDTDVGVALWNAQQKSQMLIKQELLIRWREDLQVKMRGKRLSVFALFSFPFFARSVSLLWWLILWVSLTCTGGAQIPD